SSCTIRFTCFYHTKFFIKMPALVNRKRMPLARCGSAACPPGRKIPVRAGNRSCSAVRCCAIICEKCPKISCFFFHEFPVARATGRVEKRRQSLYTRLQEQAGLRKKPLRTM